MARAKRQEQGKAEKTSVETRLLDKINSPQDLKGLSMAQLYQLSEEIREYIINIVAETGGHLASNLGVVELTLALHLVFDFSRDRIIWDVGHQSYVHKILTGRKNLFPTLRQYGGISGFPKTSESEYDAFNTGHSSTSISAALGMARARDLKGEDYKVVAVIGDGALTGGMAFEALNDAGSSDTDLIIVINDNEMSITKNVGGMSAHLRKLSSRPGYTKLKKKVRERLLKIPGIGKYLLGLATRLKESVKHFVTEDVIFDDLGLKFIGTVDGHNIKELCQALTLAVQTRGPVVVHVSTTKGKGYRPAEKMPEKYHGIAPFNINTGSAQVKNNLSNSEFFGKILCQLAEEDPALVAITAAMAEGTGLKDFARKFPDRFYDVGIAEQHAVTMAAGLAMKGIKPCVAIYSSFLQRAYDQLLHDVALQKLPVLCAIDRAGVVGEDGETHQGIYDLSYLLMLPNFTVMVPAYRDEFKAMLEYYMKEAEGPVAIRYPKTDLNYSEWDEDKDNILLRDLFRAVVMKEGTDVTLAATGAMVPVALEAAGMLEMRGISAEVINVRVIKPLDLDTVLNSLNKTQCLVTLEDNVTIGGFGSNLLALLTENSSPCPAMILGWPDQPIPHGSRNVMLKKYGLDAAGVADRIEKFCYERGKKAVYSSEQE